MPLPPVAFFSIYEIAVRWGCPPADVAGWAAAGHLHVVAGIPPVLCGDETVAGMVQVPMAELMGMFRRMGPSDDQARLKRVMPLGSKTWLKITDPTEGLLVRSSDLLLDSGTLQAFEEERDLLRRPAGALDELFGVTERSWRWHDLLVREGRPLGGTERLPLVERGLRGRIAERGDDGDRLDARRGGPRASGERIPGVAPALHDAQDIASMRLHAPGWLLRMRAIVRVP